MPQKDRSRKTKGQAIDTPEGPHPLRRKDDPPSSALPKLLFVDDEPGIRLTLSAVLEKAGFQVTVASTVPEALALMTAQRYDVLVSDLNIGQPGDGFTVVSAMRRTQPKAATIILTGFPAFESALRAIREQVDDFVLKPADLGDLVTTIQHALAGHGHHPVQQTRRLQEVLAANKDGLAEHWLKLVEKRPELLSIPLTKEERLNDLPEILDELTGRGAPEDAGETKLAVRSAWRHGKLRRQQGYSVPMMLREGALLQLALSDCVQRHLLDIEISTLVSDLAEVTSRLHELLEQSVRAYLAEDVQPRVA